MRKETKNGLCLLLTGLISGVILFLVLGLIVPLFPKLIDNDMIYGFVTMITFGIVSAVIYFLITRIFRV